MIKGSSDGRPFAVALVALSFLGLLGGPAAQGAEVCLQLGDSASCLSANSLRQSGIAFVKFVPGSLARVSGQTSWDLLAFDARANFSSAPTLIRAAWTGNVSGDLQVLALQDKICQVVHAAGIDCSRDYLDGCWQTNSLGSRRSFAVEFQTTQTVDQTATGAFTTHRWSCRKGAKEIELVCKGTYDTSLRLLYLANASQLDFSGVTCGEGETRDAMPGTDTLPLCDGSGTYGDSSWSPFGQPGVALTWVDAGRVYLPDVAIPLYFVKR